MPPLRALGALFVAACLSVAAAQVCEEELRSALPDQHLDRQATGLDAALLMHTAVTLVEPALPALMRPNVGVPEDHAAFATVRSVAGWGLLPDTWSVEALDASTWRQMNRRFLGWYKQDGPLPEEVGTVADLVEDLSATLDRVSDAIRPAALLASAQDDGGELSFMAIIWNWTVYPRLLVFQPETGIDISTSPKDVLPHLSNCVVKVSAYITAPEETAKDLFLAHNDSRMFVVATEPPIGSLPLEVQAGQELGAFAFDMPELAATEVYAAVFDGPEVGFATLIGLLSRVKTNVSPVSIMSYMQTP